jgi:ABC-type nitrate/sulfonate/bicarbonate transport system substrate-binding protein
VKAISRVKYPALLAAAALVTMGAAACSSSPSSSSGASAGGSSASASSGGGVDTTAVKIAYDSAPDIGDLPSLVAMKMMRSEGYNINPQILNGSSVTADAVSTGSAQMASLNGISVFQAVSKGNSFVAFAEKYTNEEVLVAKSSITSVSQLNGATVSVQSPQATSTSLVLYTEKTNNLNIKFVYQPNSATRAAALESGQVDASPLELDDVDKILNSTGHQYHVLISYDKTLPWILGNIFFTSKSFLAAHKPLVQAFVNALAKADQQAYANPDAFVAQNGNLLSGYTPSVLKVSMEESAGGKIWGTADGVLSGADAAKTLTFDQTDGLLTAAQVSQLSSTESSWIKTMKPTSS